MQKIIVLGSETKSGVSKKGSAYSMVVVQCNVADQDGKIIAGELILPKGHPEVKPGNYTASFKLGKSSDGKVGAVVDTLSPLKAA